MTRIHIAMNTADLDAATAFYTALFEEGPDKVRDQYRRFQPISAPITLSLQPGQPTQNANHLGLRVQTSDDVKAAHARLAAQGLVGVAEEATTCCWAVQDKFWLTDPDGRMWEVYTVLDEQTEVARDDDTACCVSPPNTATSCCS